MLEEMASTVLPCEYENLILDELHIRKLTTED